MVFGQPNNLVERLLVFVSIQAYAAGCDIVILASDFQRVQIIPGAIHGYIQVTCIDCCTDTGKVSILNVY